MRPCVRVALTGIVINRAARFAGRCRLPPEPLLTWPNPPQAGPSGYFPITVRGVSLMSDLAFIVLTVVVFAVLGLVAKGVEKL